MNDPAGLTINHPKPAEQEPQSPFLFTLDQKKESQKGSGLNEDLNEEDEPDQDSSEQEEGFQDRDYKEYDLLISSQKNVSGMGTFEYHTGSPELTVDPHQHMSITMSHRVSPQDNEMTHMYTANTPGNQEES